MRKVSPGLCASLDAGDTWRASFSLPAWKNRQNVDNSLDLLRSLGNGSHIAGVETMSTQPAMKNYPVAQHHAGKATPLLCTERASRARQNLPPRKKAKKNARHARSTAGEFW